MNRIRSGKLLNFCRQKISGNTISRLCFKYKKRQIKKLQKKIVYLLFVYKTCRFRNKVEMLHIVKRSGTMLHLARRIYEAHHRCMKRSCGS